VNGKNLFTKFSYQEVLSSSPNALKLFYHVIFPNLKMSTLAISSLPALPHWIQCLPSFNISYDWSMNSSGGKSFPSAHNPDVAPHHLPKRPIAPDFLAMHHDATVETNFLNMSSFPRDGICSPPLALYRLEFPSLAAKILRDTASSSQSAVAEVETDFHMTCPCTEV
jgi:hypothetical protein